MEQFKKILKLLLFPHPAVVVLIVPLSIALLVYSFVFLGSQETVSYISYALSAYALTLICVRAPKWIRFFKNHQIKNAYLKRFISDEAFQMNVSLYGSLLYNTAYALLQLGLGFYHHALWYYSLAGYYIVLGLMRFFLLKHIRTHQKGEDPKLELLLYRFCGMLLLLLNMALSGILFYMVARGRTFVHHEITTIAMAAYTFTMLTRAIINVVKYRKRENPVLSAAKVVSFAAALVSLITLENTMLTTFGEVGQENLRLTMLALTGFAVNLLILLIAVYMIVTSTKKIKEFKNGRKEL